MSKYYYFIWVIVIVVSVYSIGYNKGRLDATCEILSKIAPDSKGYKSVCLNE